MVTIKGPDFPVIGVPAGQKQGGQRVDFKVPAFELAIETKGYLLCWERATICPCTPITTKTEQPDPNCPVCRGAGWTYFGQPSVPNPTSYQLDELQTAIVAQNNGMLIRGIMTSLAPQENNLDVIGRWVSGTANLTVRHQNRLGYYDKITTLDTEIVFSEVRVADGGLTLPTRYPVVNVNYLRSVNQIYKIGDNFVVDKGVITWRDGTPVNGTRLSVHYLCHPVWLIVEHPHAIRTTQLRRKVIKPLTPTGDPKQMPIQALVRLDFLPGPE